MILIVDDVPNKTPPVPELHHLIVPPVETAFRLLPVPQVIIEGLADKEITDGMPVTETVATPVLALVQPAEFQEMIICPSPELYPND